MKFKDVNDIIQEYTVGERGYEGYTDDIWEIIVNTYNPNIVYSYWNRWAVVGFDLKNTTIAQIREEFEAEDIYRLRDRIYEDA